MLRANVGSTTSLVTGNALHSIPARILLVVLVSWRQGQRKPRRVQPPIFLNFKASGDQNPDEKDERREGIHV